MQNGKQDYEIMIEQALILPAEYAARRLRRMIAATIAQRDQICRNAGHVYAPGDRGPLTAACTDAIAAAEAALAKLEVAS